MNRVEPNERIIAKLALADALLSAVKESGLLKRKRVVRRRKKAKRTKKAAERTQKGKAKDPVMPE